MTTRKKTDSPTRLSFSFPEPPSMNQMLALAKKRTRKGRDGGWMKRSMPIVYDNARHSYQLDCLRETRAKGVRPPKQPWKYWAIVSVSFRLHSLRDPIELAAGLKWAIDFLVKEGYVADDSPRELHAPKNWPLQSISRQDRGVDIVIKRMSRKPKQ